MKKLAISCLSILFVSISCDKKEKSKQSNEVTTDSTPVGVIDHHTAKMSLDYVGSYKGITPCADCEGIETTLYLSNESKYVLQTNYLGKKEAVVNEKRGTYSWNEVGNTVILSGIKSGPSQYFVGENYVVQLDMEGNKIAGDLADNYILQKTSDEKELPPPPPPAPVSIKNSRVHPKSVINTLLIKNKWKLVELNGKPIENKNDSKKEMFIQLNNEGRYTAFAGCNSMIGSFELKDEKALIAFTKGASTMMACIDMETEQEFAKMLETVDNYSINGNQMTLNKARMAPLARFEAMK